jgi:hypothetical protein
MRFFVGCFLILTGSIPIRAAAPPERSPSESQLASRIDFHLARAWRGEKVVPAPDSTDEEFLRRASLDLVGRIPRIDEVRAFLADKRGERRQRLINRLLGSAGHANHLARVWRSFLVPQATTNLQTQHLGVTLEAWLRSRFRARLGYDRIVFDLLTAPLDYLDRKPDGPSKLESSVSPVAFYQANDLKAETVASSAARLFLGIRLECAQCHDHPFDKWTRKQFWQTAAFFAAVSPLPPGKKAAPGERLDQRRALTVPEAGGTIEAHFLDGKSPDWKHQPDPRRVLARWVTGKDNPFFARVAVNRVWAQMFGFGLVDPLDDFGPHNRPSHPELLDELARAFSARQFDLAFLYRAISRTRAYQMTSRSTHPSQKKNSRLFARMNVKGLTAEQLFDSLAQATGYREAVPLAAQPAFGYGRDSPRGKLLARFGGGQSRTDMQASILQALALMNGEWIARQADPERGEMLKAVISAPFLDDSERLESLFLATLSRRPRAQEKAHLLEHIESGRKRGKEKQALADVFWVLLNSHEFLLNH